MKRTILFLLTLILCSFSVFAQLELPSIISNSMVLQQNSKVKLWGKATANSSIVISETWSNTQVKATASADGLWEVQIPTTVAGGPYTITIENGKDKKILEDILLGEVWFGTGQSNMDMPIGGFKAQPIDGALNTMLKANKYPNIRVFKTERTASATPRFSANGKWKASSLDNIADMTAIGYYFAKELTNVLNVPVGIVQVSWGGSRIQAWMGTDALKMFPEIDISSISENAKRQPHEPTLLHNGMFIPAAKFTARGILWYQGESNVYDANLYSKLFPAMVKEWREIMQQGDLPFYYVQIAPFDYPKLWKDETLRSEFLRESQLNSQKLIPNSEMVVALDAGEKEIIHPANKEILAKRLACIALAKDYGYKNIPHKNPSYSKSMIKDDRIILTFKDAKRGLLFKSQNNDTGFEIAGDDKAFVPAEIKIDVDKIEVWSPLLKNPKHVRYAFKNYVSASIFDIYGFPVSSFRTDNWVK